MNPTRYREKRWGERKTPVPGCQVCHRALVPGRAKEHAACLVELRARREEKGRAKRPGS